MGITKKCPFRKLAWDKETEICIINVTMKLKSTGGYWDYSGGVGRGGGSTEVPSFGPCQENECSLKQFITTVLIEYEQFKKGDENGNSI